MKTKSNLKPVTKREKILFQIKEFGTEKTKGEIVKKINTWLTKHAETVLEIVNIDFIKIKDDYKDTGFSATVLFKARKAGLDGMKEKVIAMVKKMGVDDLSDLSD